MSLTQQDSSWLLQYEQQRVAIDTDAALLRQQAAAVELELAQARLAAFKEERARLAEAGL